MKTSVKVKTDSQNKLRQSSKRNIVLSIIHNRDKFQITLSVPPINPEYLTRLNDGFAEISAKAKNYKNRSEVNKLINDEKIRVEGIIFDLSQKGLLDTMSTKELKDYLRNYKPEIEAPLSFFAFADKIIEEKKSIGKHNTARSMIVGIASVKKFSSSLTFDEITYTFLKEYETWYLTNGKSLNGLAGIMRYIRAVYNRAIKEDLLSETNYPFRKYSIKTKKTRKRAISKDEMKLILDYKPTCDSERLAKDIFFFSFYNAGINFKDIALLTKSNIKKGRLIYARSKTEANFNLELNKQSLEILNRYETEGEYLFPLIIQPKLKGFDLMTHINDRNHHVNRYLRNIGKKLELEFPLTTYVARHTFATIAKKNNVPIAVISELLGHEDIKTTQIYLGSLDNDTLDDYRAQITDL